MKHATAQNIIAKGPYSNSCFYYISFMGSAAIYASKIMLQST